MTGQEHADEQGAGRAGQGPPGPELRWSQRPGHDRTGVEAHLAAFVGIDSLHHRAPVDELVLPDPARIRQYLEEGWRIPDVRQLRAQILDLLWRGQSQKFTAERETWSRLDPEALSEIEAELRLDASDGDASARETLVRLQRVRDADPATMAADFVVWDHVRVIELARAGRTAGMLDDAEALDTALLAAGSLRERCTSWEDFSEKLRVSRRHWASLPEPISTRFDAKTDAELDLLRTDPASPWMTIPWFAPLPDPEYLVLDAFVADNPPAQDQVVPTQPTEGRPSRWRERFVQAFGARLEAAQK